MFASYAALDLAGRVTAADGWTRAVWLLGGPARWALAFGPCTTLGCWRSSCRLPCLPLADRSAVTVCGHSRVDHCAVRGEPTENGCVPSARRKCPNGCGYCEYALHRHGRHALPAVCEFNSFLVVLSVVFAVLISLAALWITFHFRDEKTGIGWGKTAGAVVMGAAIPVMHYTGMAAASFTPSGMPADLSHA